jgi:ATP synthase protein I
MPESPEPAHREREFRRHVSARTARKQRARSQTHDVWFGLGMFGVVGWSVALPTLLGVMTGLWLDDRLASGGISWTLTFLGVGLGIGCLIAWQWVRREGRM